MCRVRLIGEVGGSCRCEYEGFRPSYCVAHRFDYAARSNFGPVSLRGCTIDFVTHGRKARMIANPGRSRDCRRELRCIMDLRSCRDALVMYSAVFPDPDSATP
jgi:hypothetical protein